MNKTATTPAKSNNVAKANNVTKTETSVTTPAVETEKDKKTFVKRTADELKKTEKGKIVVILRAAMSLANVKSREGLNLETIEPKDETGKLKTAPMLEKEGSRQLAARMNLITREGGKITLIEETDANYVKLKALAQAALPTLQKSQYEAKVKALVNFCLDTLSVGTGKRGFNPSTLTGLEL